MNEIVDFLTDVFKDVSKPVALSEPIISQSDIGSVQETLEKGYVSSLGGSIDDFEKQISKNFDDRYAVCLNSGTSALHLALNSMGVESNQEVIVQPLTFVATINAIRYLRATPTFIDIEQDYLSLSHEHLKNFILKSCKYKNKQLTNTETGRKITAVVMVDVFGNIGHQKEIYEICKDYNLKLIVDAAESIGAKRYEKSSGYYSDITTTSFNGNKIITSGMGGAVISKNSKEIENIRHLASTANIAKKTFGFDHDEVAYNYRLPALNAALGLSQILSLDEKLLKRKKIYDFYKEKFENFNLLNLHTKSENFTNFWLNSISLSDETSFSKFELIRLLNDLGILVRDIWVPHHLNKINADCYREELNNTDNFYIKSFNLPSSFDV